MNQRLHSDQEGQNLSTPGVPFSKPSRVPVEARPKTPLTRSSGRPTPQPIGEGRLHGRGFPGHHKAFAAGPLRGSRRGIVARAVLLLILCVMNALGQVPPDKITDFPTFFSTFEKAVRAQDRQTVRQMLSDEIIYTFGRGLPGDRRDATLKFWDSSDGWKEVEAALAAGYGYVPERRAIISPPTAYSGDFPTYRVHFNRVSGYWRVTVAVGGD